MIFVWAILSLFSSNSYASESKCFEKMKLEFLENGKVVSKLASFCVTDSPWMVISKSCLKNAGCLALKNMTKASLSTAKIQSSTANPYFNACKIRGGKPRIYSYSPSKGAAKVELSLCEFSDDSFVNVEFSGS